MFGGDLQRIRFSKYSLNAWFVLTDLYKVHQFYRIVADITDLSGGYGGVVDDVDSSDLVAAVG